jgi:ribosomal protein S18 acetylase RimI-like enzyme
MKNWRETLSPFFMNEAVCESISSERQMIMSYTIRRAKPEDANAIARVQVAGWHSTYTGLMPESLLANQTVERREPMWRRALAQPDQFPVYVARAESDDEQEVVGLVSGGPPQDGTGGWYHDFDSELYAIYILKEYQGSGIGRALLEKMLAHLVAEGKSAMLLWVLEENHQARRFYERMGGTLLEYEKFFQTDEGALREVAYGWRGLKTYSGKSGKS